MLILEVGFCALLDTIAATQLAVVCSELVDTLWRKAIRDLRWLFFTTDLIGE